MSAEQAARMELAHIGRVIAELERIAASAPAAMSRHPVMRPEYWKRRLDALTGSPRTNDALRRDAAALRERLASLLG